MGFNKKSCVNCELRLHILLMKEDENEYYCPDCFVPRWTTANSKNGDPLTSD